MFTAREIGLLIVGAGVAGAFLMGMHPEYYGWYAMAGVSFAVLVGAILIAYGWAHSYSDDVDIWKLQHRLMAASGQSLPQRPELNADTILYVALTLEELSEGMETIRFVLMRDRGGRWSNGQLSLLLRDVQEATSLYANKIRRELEKHKGLRIPLTRTEAHDLLDATTDATVTIAGMPLAAGLPASGGYLEVQESNWSKRNPVTGMIDKDASGKWIKGPLYYKPDLNHVLDQTWLPPRSSNT